MMKIINAAEFDDYWKKNSIYKEDEATETAVREIIESVRREGDRAVRHYASMFDKSSPDHIEVPPAKMKAAVSDLELSDQELAGAIRLAAENTRRFSLKQREQFADFEFENSPGLFTGQKIIPVQRAGVYIPGGRFPLISSALMCLIPAICSGVKEICFASPPTADGYPDKRILAAAGIVLQICGYPDSGFRIFSMGGAQAIAALALGTETVPRCDVVAGPGNKYVAEAKRLLYGQTGIDFIAGPSDILVITGEDSMQLPAVDMLAQAEHDPDARARALVPSAEAAQRLAQALKKNLEEFPAGENKNNAASSLENGGLIVIYRSKEEAIRIANNIAPEHLELHVPEPENWIPSLMNFGSMFIGAMSAEVLGDYSAGINHILPTLGSARFTGGLSVRHFLKTVTTLRCNKDSGLAAALDAARIIAASEGLEGHRRSAQIRI